MRPSVTLKDLINNIGPPFDNTSAFVLDPNSDTVLPRGAVGELCFGGEQVFRGYLNRPELNATKLINIPPYGRIYRSGDMGRLLPDDCILSAGRSDDQVKIRGQRVELGEITSTVLDNDDVADCATLLLSTESDAKYLVTFWVHKDHRSERFTIVKHGKTRTTILQIFGSLSKQLPGYMIPSYLIAVSTMPMTAQAKIDKRLLQASFCQLEESALAHFTSNDIGIGEINGDTTGPAGPLAGWERSIAEVFAQTIDIDVEKIRPSSSFFNLGLDSVSAIRFCHRLRQADIADFTVAEVLKNPTVASLNELRVDQPSSPRLKRLPIGNLDNIFTKEQRSSICSTIAAQSLEVEKLRPCTPLQEAMLASSASSEAAYSNTMIFDIKGDVVRLQASWTLTQTRHEILRTSFLPVNHPTFAFAQVVLKASELQWIELHTLENVQSSMDAILRDLLAARKPPLCLAIHLTESTTKLVFSCHHALYDGIAIANLLQEIQRTYAQHEVPLATSFDCYLQHMVTHNLTDTHAFWSSRFSDFEPTYFPDLTGKAFKNPANAHSTKTCELQLPLSVLRAASQQASVSALSMVQAAWVKLLHYYTNEHDLCFGNVVSGRALPENGLDQLIAPCFNTLPVRAKFDFSQSNLALVQHLHNFNVESYTHQLTALRRIQNTVLDDGGQLFDTLVILQQPSKPLDEAIWSLEADLGEMDLPIVCEVHQNDQTNSLRLTLHYENNLLADEDAHIVAQTFDSSLAELVSHFDAAANEPVGLPQSLRAESNPNYERLAAPSDLLHKAFERNALNLPLDAVALDFLHLDGRRTVWSYQKLNLVANHVAERLISRAVGLEDIVPVHIEKSPMFYASILGVLKAGAAFAPIHPDLPEARKDLMFRDLHPKVVLCTEHAPRLGEEFSMVPLNITDLENSILGACETPHVEDLSGSTLAYCLYTSGSTGVPKAVSMEHQSPIQTIESSRTLVPWTPSSRLLQYAAVTFDMCYYDCFMAWTFGFALCAAEQGAMFDNLPRVINSLDASLLDLTPSVAASLARDDVPSVQWLYCIGESMSSDVAREWGGACVNSYGPTEAAFCTTMFPISQDMKTAIIGRPYPSTSFAIFSPHGQQPLPLLSAGELYIGGVQLAREYHGRPELTDERFVTRCGQRFYKSGDMVRMLNDGNFEFIGRADDQVKLRGLRVELGEINQVLQNCHSHISSVVTQILKKNSSAKEQLVSFLATGAKLIHTEESGLREVAMQTAKDRLPAYMVPQIYVFVDRIPKSEAGKVDKKALTNIFRSTTNTQSLTNGGDRSHTWTAAESQVRDVLSHLTNTPLDEILPEVSIYHLGLDSISAVQIASALRSQSYDVSAADVMKAPTCIGLAKCLEKRPQGAESRLESFDFETFDKKHRPAILKTSGLDDRSIEAIRPCTPLQQSMISQFIAKEGLVYYNYVRLKLQPTTDPMRLKDAWEKTMMRHPILRSGFAHVKDEQYSFAMIQHTIDSARLPWSQISDADPQSTTVKSRHLQREALNQLHQPMWNVKLVANDRESFLDLWIFHALFDAHSLQLIFEDVVAFYNNESLKVAPPFDSTLSELLQLTDNLSGQADQFWSDLGKQTVPSRFPNMTPLRSEPAHPEVITKISSISSFEIDKGCRTKETTLQAVGIASWSTILSAYTGEPTVTMGVVLSGRISDAANSAVFPCINTVPFPCTVIDDKMALLKSIMELNAELHQHQFMLLNKAQKLMRLPNETLFDSLFAVQKIAGGSHQNSLWTVAEEHATTEYPVSIELEQLQEGLRYRLTYLPHVIPPQQASLILEQLDSVMKSFLVTSTKTTPESWQDHSLYSITPAKEPFLPSEVHLLHDLVEVTAGQHPDRIAFEFASAIHDGQLISRRWSYVELDAEGNRIANLLLAHNIQQGGLIGVCFDKCPEASFAMLGILKAGCAFVAVDPSAPSARQSFIVEDSGAQVVLTMSAQSAKFRADVKVPVLDLDKINTRCFPASKPQLERNVDTQDRSYCLYTSGTTGTPKGCELTHENAVQALLAFQRLFQGHWNAESRWLQFASFHFDVSVLEQYWSWSVGICVVSAPRDLIFEDLANSIRTLGITHIDLTPSLALILHPDDVPSLCKGVFITGGESLKQEILDVWGPKSVIYNGYGPTEATIGCTMYPRVPANGKPSNIGPQFDNVGSYVLQPESDIPVLRGGVGELCVSGKLVGKGYLNRPELTEERFAHLVRFDERVYRTGDLVRILHNNTFEFLGRADDQVKLRGQRLEIGEINSIIRQSSQAFTDVATLVLKHPQQRKEQLVAFVVIGIKSPREPKVLLVETPRLVTAKEACHDRLPPYMVPTHFVPLASMPLNINNKADGKQLKHIYEALSSNDLQQLSMTSNGTNEAWSEQEEKLCHILAEALGIDKQAISKNSSFYELGMDSISVIGVSRAAREAGFPQITAAMLLKNATITRLIKAMSTSGLDQQDRSSLIAAKQAISAVQHQYRRMVAQSLGVESQDVEALAPCTPLQQGMIARYLDSEDGLYFNTFKFDLKDRVDISRLRWAWDAIFQDLQILRTAFVSTDNGHVQAVLRNALLPWAAHDFGNAEPPDCLTKLRQGWLAANRLELSRPFEIHLVSRPRHKLLLVHIFHALYDGNSVEMLFEKVWRMYNGTEAESREAPTFHEALPHGPLGAVEGAREFWKAHLGGNTPEPLPCLTKSPARGTIVMTRQLEPLTAFEATRRRLNVTAQAIAQTCWTRVLQNYAQASTITGMIVSGRSLELAHADLIIGPMFNTIPYHHQTQDSDTWASAIVRAHEFNTAALPYQHTPLRDILKWCKRSSAQPLFDTVFVYQVASEGTGDWRSNTVWEQLDGEAVADFPLAIEIEQRGADRFSITLVSQGHISDAKTSRDLLDRFEEALRSAVDDPSTTLETLVAVTASTSNSRTAEPRRIKRVNGAPDFEWNEDAIAIREEMVTLTGAEPADINEITSIFELGLDSIDAIKLSSRLKKRGLNLTVSGIMRGLAIQNMVTNIRRDQIDSVHFHAEAEFAHLKSQLQRYVKLRTGDLTSLDKVLPLTPLQEAMVAEMLASDHTRYYNFDIAELAAETDVDRLMNAWRTVIRSTPILRTAFLEVDDPNFDGAYAQVVVKQDLLTSQVKKQHVEATQTPDFTAILHDLRRAASQSEALDPPFKIIILETAQHRYQIISIAHALYDGWSLGLLHDSVNAAYHGRFDSPPDYEGTLANILGGSGPEAANFWKDSLSGLKPSLLPCRQLNTTEEGMVHRHEKISDTVLVDITKFAKSSKVSLQTLGQAIFAMTLASYVGSLDVTFGCVLSGRDDEESSRLVFPTMNTVAIRTILHGSRLGLLRYVQDNFNSIKQWQHYPLRKASALTGTPGKLFNTLFIYQKNVVQGCSTGEELYHSIESESNVEYPLCVEMEVVNDRLVWRCAVKDEVMDSMGAQTLLSRLDQVLRNIIQSPDGPTIESTSQGTSVCGLPAFQKASLQKPEDNSTNEQMGSTTDAPPSETIVQIRKALASVAQIPEDTIGSGVSIFHIGLDSISAIKVSSILRKQGIGLSVGQMLKASTVEKMAEVVDERALSANDVEDPKTVIRRVLSGVRQAEVLSLAAIKAVDVDCILPLSAGQLYMVSMWLNSKGANFYPEFVYDLDCSANLETLRNLWKELVISNPILRTCIVKTGQRNLPYAQIVLQKAYTSLTDVTDCDKSTVRSTIQRTATREPWVHLFVTRTATGWSLKLKIHHALYDGVSLPLLMRQLEDLCNGVTLLQPANVFDEYIALAHTASAASQRKAFWTKYFEDFDQDYNTCAQAAPLSKSEIYQPRLLRTLSLQGTARRHGVSTQAVFLAVYARLYATKSERTETQDVVIGIYLANRALPMDNLSTAVIPTLNLLPLRINAPLSTPLVEVAKQIQHDLQTLNEPAYATSSLFDIHEWTGVKVNIFVNFLSLPDAEEKGATSGADRAKVTQKDGWQEAVSRVTPINLGGWQPPAHLVDERVNASYLVSLHRLLHQVVTKS